MKVYYMEEVVARGNNKMPLQIVYRLHVYEAIFKYNFGLKVPTAPFVTHSVSLVPITNSETYKQTYLLSGCLYS